MPSQCVVDKHRDDDQGQVDNIPPAVEEERGSNQKGFSCLGLMLFVEVEIDKKGKRQEKKDKCVGVEQQETTF